MKKAPSVFKIAVGSRDPDAPPQTETSGLCKGYIFEASDYSACDVPNVFEGDYEIVHYDTSTLSIIVAEMDAKKDIPRLGGRSDG